MKTDLTIIIPHHKDEERLESLLASIKDQKTDFSFEVLIVSNPGSSKADHFASLDERFKNINLDDVGVNKARNVGLKNANGEILFFLDSDCVLNDVHILKKHRDFHLKFPHIGCVGGLYRSDSREAVDKAYNYLQRRWLYWGLEQDNSKYLLGGHFSCKKSLIKNHQFDENIVWGGSETEFFFRLFSDRVVMKLDDHLEVLHDTQMSSSELVKKLYRQGLGSKFLKDKHQRNDFYRYSEARAVRLVENAEDQGLRFYIYLADEAFNKGVRGGRGGRDKLTSLEARLFMVKAYFKYKFLLFSKFFRSLKVLFK